MNVILHPSHTYYVNNYERIIQKYKSIEKSIGLRFDYYNNNIIIIIEIIFLYNSFIIINIICV